MEVEKGLYLTVSGGYSAYYDGPNIDILFCETCSKKLIETFPAIGDRINASGLA
jgi:hypothetical protein